ncbi:uncharacterized protein LOC131689003 isoform X2 [Topomyia yanbarensis]|uniref:uncharacterized protein LOC131689003 isoform X2 n=1 Tax=Topomyia yanbarensis TaxID=2498891 RepID=UPI00273B178E|nr:uncharacterized protein LOC131689003 isoform X2 [Topomyia yanbarensis]
MKVTSSPIGMLWEILMLIITAHALGRDVPAQDSDVAPILGQLIASSPSSTVSASKSDDLTGKSVVVNWKLTCQQLCSEGYGGPACGLSCLQQNATNGANRIKLTTVARNEVCSTLCVNGLGLRKCGCAPKLPPHIAHDHDGVCNAFCATAKIQLNGCSQCTGEHFSNSTTDPDIKTTTPNWDDLCTIWCKMGEGGTLCNCDLPPFV